MMQDVHVELNMEFPMERTVFNKKQDLFPRKLNLNLKKKLVECYIWSTALCGAETWTLRKVDLKYRKILKCGAGEGWRRSFGPNV
jgi:hypothetical protein